MPVLMLLRQLLLKLLKKLWPDLAGFTTYVIKAGWLFQPAFFMPVGNSPEFILIPVLMEVRGLLVFT